MQLPPTKHVSTSQWPVIVYTAPGAVSDDEMQAVMDEVQTLKRLGAVHALVLDVRKVSQLSPKQRRMITTQMEDDKAITEQFTAGVALVFESRLLRGFLTAIFWVRPAIAPTRVFNAPQDAIAWCAAQAAAKITSSTAPSLNG